ncbi:MAG: hypothetical protein KKA19_09345 [Candidatus Margulisbacteria bacterium]|nr:hypothetical protein [Candidatus Margulisiibacteriota bacterium]
MKNVLFLVLILALIFQFNLTHSWAEEDDYFLMEDFEEPVPDYVKESPAEKDQTLKEEKMEERPVDRKAFSVKKRTYLTIHYGQTAFAGGSQLDTVLKDENTYFKDTFNWTKTPFKTPITSGLTGGIEIKKGWSDYLMLGLEVFNTLGVSPEKTINVPPNKLIASARFEITTTFFNAYLYGPISPTLEYYIGGGLGVGSGIVQYNEELNNSEFESKVTDKASGAQIFTGLDWKLSEVFFMQAKLFYRAMELRNVSLTGGGLTVGLGVAF